MQRSAAGLQDWKTRVPLDFLTTGKRYSATIYEDNAMGGIQKRTVDVKKGDLMPVDIKAKGGQAIIIRPVMF